MGKGEAKKARGCIKCGAACVSALNLPLCASCDGSLASEIISFGVRGNGARALGVRAFDGVEVLITPSSEGDNGRATYVANLLTDAATTDAERVSTIAQQQAEIDALKAQLKTARAKVADLERINEAAITGRRRFFGPVLMRPAVTGDWSGEVWLMDPTKQERGTALRFMSVAEVRELHPELWVVSATADGVMLDARAILAAVEGER